VPQSLVAPNVQKASPMTTRLLRTLLLAGLTYAMGCDGRSSLPTGSAIDPNALDPKAPGGTQQAPVPAACAATGGQEITFASLGDAQMYLTGRWVLCGGPGLSFATEQPKQAGVELTADRGWTILRADGQGLAPADGFQASGSYIFGQPQHLMLGPSKQATLFFGLDWSFAEVTMLDSPRKMRVKFSEPLDDAPSIYARVD
jgi:hypothetical protein